MKRTFLLLGTLATASVLAFTACSDDDDVDPATSASNTSGNVGGGGGDGGSGGTTTSNGGTGGTGGSGGTGGAGGTGGGGSGGFSSPNCDDPTGTPGGLTLTEVASGFNTPLQVTHAPGDDERLFVIEQNGAIRLIKDGVVTTFVDIDEDNKVNSGGERGLLGIAFHPNYANNGRFFVHYSGGPGSPAPGGDTVIQEFQRDANDPDVADPTPVQTILTVVQPAGNHNGGSIEFSPVDGFLYIALGDGGGSNDQYANGQDTDTLLGALLRLDVDGGTPYAIPPGNHPSGAAEIYDWGLRNPYRFNFDLCNGDRYIGDVGQNAYEEVDIASPADGGLNWGWNIMEGNQCFSPPNGCDMSGLALPAVDYSHSGTPSSGGHTVTGGAVYRGDNIPWLRGAYFYSEFYAGPVWMLRWSAGSVDEHTEVTDDLYDGGSPLTVSAFGNDNQGEVYVVSIGNGTIYRIDPE